MNNHLIDFVVTDEEVLVRDGIVCRCITVQGVVAGRPQVCAEDVQVENSLRVARVKLEEVFPPLRYALNRGTDRHEDGGFVLGAAHNNTSDLVEVRLRGLEALSKFSLLVLPVFQLLVISNNDCGTEKSSVLARCYATYTFEASAWARGGGLRGMTS